MPQLKVAVMPAKKTQLLDSERAKRIRETAREVGTNNDPASFDRAFEKVVQHPKVGASDTNAQLVPGVDTPAEGRRGR
jgi:hypothetical protein